jgi:hypothetical protein
MRRHLTRLAVVVIVYEKKKKEENREKERPCISSISHNIRNDHEHTLIIT